MDKEMEREVMADIMHAHVIAIVEGTCSDCIVLNVGAEHGVKVGDSFIIGRGIKTIQDRYGDGEILGGLEIDYGTYQASQVFEKFCTLTYSNKVRIGLRAERTSSTGGKDALTGQYSYFLRHPLK